MNYELADVFVLLAGVVVVIAFLVMFIIKFIVSVYFPFVDEYEHIKYKIMFSTSYDERVYWLREKRRLYISCIPGIGGFIAKRMVKKKDKRYSLQKR